MDDVDLSPPVYLIRLDGIGGDSREFTCLC